MTRVLTEEVEGNVTGTRVERCRDWDGPVRMAEEVLRLASGFQPNYHSTSVCQFEDTQVVVICESSSSSRKHVWVVALPSWGQTRVWGCGRDSLAWQTLEELRA